MEQRSPIFLFKGLTKKDFGVLKTFWDNKDPKKNVGVHYKVWASSQKALPSNQDMHEIGKIAPCIFFPPGGFPKSPQSFNETELRLDFIDKDPCSLIFLDNQITRVWYKEVSIDVRDVLTQVLFEDGFIIRAHSLDHEVQQQV